MASKTGSQRISEPAWIVLGAVAGLLIAPSAELSPGWGIAAGAVVAYLGLCVKRPWVPCWRAKCGTTDKAPGRGRRAPFGVRRDCWLCGGRRKWLRPGARVLAVFGFRPRGSD